MEYLYMVCICTVAILTIKIGRPSFLSINTPFTFSTDLDSLLTVNSADAFDSHQTTIYTRNIQITFFKVKDESSALLKAFQVWRYLYFGWDFAKITNSTNYIESSDFSREYKVSS